MKESDGAGVPPPVDGMVTLKVTVPAPRDESSVRVPISRATSPGTVDESKVTHLRFFIFKSNENKLEKYQAITINNDGTSSDPAWSATDKTLRVTVSPGSKRIYCIANWAGVPTAEMPKLSDSTVTDTASLLAQTRRHTGVTPTNPPVMSGKLTRDIVGNEQGLKLALSRQVARIEIFPMISTMMKALGVKIKIEGVKFVRLAGESFVFEQDPIRSPVAKGWDQDQFTGVLSDSLTASKIDEAVKYPISYYVPENISTADSVATAMVIKALYNGKSTYYTVILGETVAGSSTSRTLKRNHCYNYYLTIQGIGSQVAVTTLDKRTRNPAFTNIRRERVEIKYP
jgi:hypothetical protein